MRPGAGRRVGPAPTRAGPVVRRAEMAPDRRGEVVGGHEVAGAPAVRLVDDAGELTEVAGPVVAEEDGERPLREPAPLAAPPRVGALEQVLRHQGEVVEPVA